LVDKGAITPKIFSKQKAIGAHKIYCSISQMIITTNIMLKLANFSQNLFAACQTLYAKKEFSFFLCEKASCIVDEIDPKRKEIESH
jgi:hypothetical protein